MVESLGSELIAAAQRKKRRRKILFGVSGVVMLLPFVWIVQHQFFPHLFDEEFRLEGEELDQARLLVERVAGEGAKREGAIGKTVEQAVAKLGPDEARPCLHQLPTPPKRNRNSKWQGQDWQFPFSVVTPELISTVKVVDPLGAQAHRLAARIEEPVYHEDVLADLRADLAYLDKGALRTLPYVVVFVVAARKDGGMLPGLEGKRTRFNSGIASGRAFLIEHASGDVTCAADVLAVNSDYIRFEYTTQGVLDQTGSRYTDGNAALRFDLDAEVKRAVVRDMRAVGDAAIPFSELGARGEAFLKAQQAPKPGDLCAEDDDGKSGCSGEGDALLSCVSGRVRLDHYCRGPTGCQFEDGWASCDESKARVDEPCMDVHGVSGPDNVDGDGTLTCVEGRWRRATR